ncbi:MAG TPA: hypothetical protein VNB93_05920, partial [Rubrobacter sp.]|nr:hypothetical protein [Rubrobacter sp.]
RKRRMPYDLALQALQKLLRIHPSLLPEDHFQFSASFWQVGISADQEVRTAGSNSWSDREGSILHFSRRAMAFSKSSSSVRAYLPPWNFSFIFSRVFSIATRLNVAAHPRITKSQQSGKSQITAGTELAERTTRNTDKPAKKAC